MIVLIGSTALGGTSQEARPDGLAADIAGAAVAAGSHVELVGKIGDDPAGDALVVALARAGVGHVATLRDPSRATPVRMPTDDPSEPGLDPAPAEASGGAEEAGPAPALEPADVALALRYVTDFTVVVAVNLPPEVLAEAVAAAAWAEAHLVVVQEPGSAVPDGVPADALIIELAGSASGDAADATGAGALLGRYAAAVDRGDDRSAAYTAMTAAAATGSA
jgi:hypothetical protein